MSECNFPNIEYAFINKSILLPNIGRVEAPMLPFIFIYYRFIHPLSNTFFHINIISVISNIDLRAEHTSSN